MASEPPSSTDPPPTSPEGSPIAGDNGDIANPAKLNLIPGKWIIILGVSFALAFVLLSLRMFHLFHAIPAESSAQRVLREADFIETFTLAEGVRERQLDWEDRDLLNKVAAGLVFQSDRWLPSFEPADGDVVLLIHSRGDRDSMMCLKNDGHLHLQKGSRWYRMPIDAPFEKEIRRRIADDGGPPPTTEELKALRDAALKSAESR